ncbi:hypothetical protein EVAR_62285_1 [Eumeta japonica]|uniref:Uncharacterized protein n=1 Tax=Eumeta variegata TaxID=151549 RepID=A0A4C1ZXV0_EUMVA|nr:hypothetical protein EVAR_62285_1 [Eumeta japonica]
MEWQWPGANVRNYLTDAKYCNKAVKPYQERYLLKPRGPRSFDFEKLIGVTAKRASVIRRADTRPDGSARYADTISPVRLRLGCVIRVEY